MLVLALRLALPLAVAPLVAARLSRALGTRVEIGDLSFQPLDAIITLRDVTVHAPGRPEPPIVADRVRVDVQWLPLRHRTLRVRELALESARVALDRLPDGDFSLADVAPPDPAGALPAGWSFLLDRIALRDSRLRVRDLASGAAAVVEATVRDADFSGIQQRATAFGKATNLRVDAVVGGGRVRAHGRYELRDDGLALDARAKVTDVALAHMTSYVAGLGWTDLSGRISGQLRWQREPRRRDVISGRVVLRHASVQVADLTQPALAVRRAIAEIAAIDLSRRRIAVKSLTLHGATLALLPDIAAPVPLIAAARAQPPGVARVDGTADAPTGLAPAWSWMVERFDTAEARVRVLTPGGQIDLDTHAAGENLGPGAYWSPLRIEIAHQDITAAFDGTVRLTGALLIEGRLTAGELDFPALARGAGLPWAELVQAGRATVDLTVGFDAAAGEASPFYAHGGIGLTDLWIAGQAPGGVTFGAARVDLTLEGFSTTGPRRHESGRATRVKLAEANIAEPFLLLMRKRDGRLLHAFTQEAANPPGETPEIFIADLRLGGGRAVLVDLVPGPAVTWELARVDGSAHALSLPSFTFDHLLLRGAERKLGDLQLGASRGGGTNRFELSAANLPLAATTPYLTLAGLPYRFAAGRGSFTARGSLDGAGWSADATLVLRSPELSDADAALQRAIGMPVADALALLRDQNGEVTLQLALAAPRAERGARHADRVAGALRDAIASARRTAAAAEGFAAVSVLFAPGQVELSAAARQELAPLAELLGSRPDLVVELSADTSRADQRWLAEQALRTELAKRAGFAGVLRRLGMRSDRDRIQAALAARARGAPGRLDAAERDLLERLLAESPPIGDDQLAELRQARLTQVRNYLSATHGVAAERVLVQSGARRGGIALAAVRAQVARGPDADTAGRGAHPMAVADENESQPPSP